MTNPSMRAALFHPVAPDDAAMGPLVETAIYSQWFSVQDGAFFHYARWKRRRREGRDHGEVDVVLTHRGTLRPDQAMEIKWSDKPAPKPEELTGLMEFCAKAGLDAATAITRTAAERWTAYGYDLCPALCFATPMRKSV